MPDIPNTTPLGYVGILALAFGIFLILAGLGIINFRQIDVKPGPKTWGFGIFITLLGIIFLLPNIIVELSQFSTPTPTVAIVAISTDTPIAPTESSTEEISDTSVPESEPDTPTPEPATETPILPTNTFTPRPATDTPTPEPTSTPTLISTPTSTSTPRPTNTSPAPTLTPTLQLLTMRPGCGDSYVVASNAPIKLQYGGWETKGFEIAQNQADHLTVTLILNGEVIPGQRQPLGPFNSLYPGSSCGSADIENAFGDYSIAYINSLDPGEYSAEVVYSFDEQVIDGYDSDGDGNLDTYGPGEAHRLRFTIIAEP